MNFSDAGSEKEREEGSGSGRSGEGIRGALLYDVDANRAGLANLYQDGSMLTFKGQKIQGSHNIVAKLTSLPFQQCRHSITTVDCQPSGPAVGMLVFVSGNLQHAGEQHALRLNHMFHSTGKLLCVQRHLPLELCMKNLATQCNQGWNMCDCYCSKYDEFGHLYLVL